MQVVAVDCWQIVGKLRTPWQISSGPIDRLGALLVRVTDADGHVGFGECCSRGGLDVLKAIVDDMLAPVVVGRDAEAIGGIWTAMQDTLRLRGHTRGFLLEAMAGIDIALWDLAGHRTGQSIATLMRGAGRQSVDAYASSILIGTPDAMAGEAGHLRERGFDAIKIKIEGDVDADADRVEAVRGALGRGPRLMLDANGAYDAAGAIELCRRLEPFGVFWLEEPLPLDDLPGYRRLRQNCGLRIALGEGEFTAGGFRAFLEDGLIDVLQPNVTRAGGITGVQRIAGLAAAYNLPVAPHTGASGPVCMAATLQLAGALEGFLTHEFMYLENPFKDAFDGGLPVPEAGRIEVPQGPGLGRTLADRLREAPDSTDPPAA